MAGWLHPPNWPITVKVPLAVAALMILVGVVLSEQVLTHLDQSQQRHLRDLAQSYLDGLSSAAAPSILRDDVWEVFDAIERAQALNKGVNAAETIVANADQRVIAASDPRQFPTGFPVPRIILDQTHAQPFRFDTGADRAYAMRVLAYPGREVGTIFASFDTSHLASERRGVILTLAATNGLLTLLLAAAGWALVTRMMRPIRVLSDHLGNARESGATPIAGNIVARSRGEFARLFIAYNELVHSIEQRRELSARLAEEEKLGSLGRLASALAHEINNPLGGLFNALATLKSHGHIESVRAGSIDLVERGLIGIRDVVRSTLALHRTDGSTRHLIPADIDDLGLLVAPEASRRSVTVLIHNRLASSVPVPSSSVRQATLNLLLNALAATPPGSRIDLSARIADGVLLLEVQDCGEGLPDVTAEQLTGASTSRPLRDGSGLGLWMTRRLMDMLGAAIMVERPAQGGTLVRIRVPVPQQEGLADVA